jgi:hypothetical protein
MFPSFPRYKEGTGGRGQIEPGPPVTRREMGHSIEQGAGGLSFVEIQRFCGIRPKTFETDCISSNLHLYHGISISGPTVS